MNIWWKVGVFGMEPVNCAHVTAKTITYSFPGGNTTTQAISSRYAHFFEKFGDAVDFAREKALKRMELALRATEESKKTLEALAGMNKEEILAAFRKEWEEVRQAIEQHGKELKL